MRVYWNLPENYRKVYTVNLQTDKKLLIFVNVLSLIIMAVMAIPMHFYIPIQTLFVMQDGFAPFLIRYLALILLLIAYIVLHELVHGVAMKLSGTKKVKYGFTGLYAYAGSDDYYDKQSYLAIALAPVVFWGVVLAIVNLAVPTEWFWVIYLIQIANISGAAGDFYVTVKFAKMPKDILVRDSGVGMTVYARQGGQEATEPQPQN